MLKKFKKILKRIPKSVFITFIAVVAAALIGLVSYQAWHLFAPTVIKGIDVSHYQGNISWRAIAESGDVKFSYLKATEGSKYKDPNFMKNSNGAAANGIPTGAYHFYTASSTGIDQASNFIATVPKGKGKLPPAVDIEGVATKQDAFKEELNNYVEMVTEHYGQKPIFYVTSEVYNLLYDDYKGFYFWIINVNSSPVVKGWTFWQYSSKGKIPGINGNVDLNQYKGSLWDFNNLITK
jgi:lysozyme